MVLPSTIGQLLIALHELVGGNYRVHGYHFAVFVRHLNTNGSFARNGRNNTNTQGSKAQGNIIFQVFNF